MSTELPLRRSRGLGPSVFTYLIGASALFIAACSAFFSVQGLGLLFIGSATAVMIMAASLELGKLIAASFLYRFWSQTTAAVRTYLTIAVVLLICITSLGNYGYLARAYEATNSQITVMEQQIESLQQEIEDAQKRIESSRQQSGKSSDEKRQDMAAIQQRMAQAEQLLDQALSRLGDRRKLAKDRRDRDVEAINGRIAELAGVLKKSLDSEEVAVTALNERVAVLDRAVDAYTKEGGGGFFKVDSIKKGQDLRAEQQPQRDAIAAEIGEHRKTQEKLRADHSKAVESLSAETATAQEQFKQEWARIDADEKAAREARAESVGAAEKQLAALQSQTQVASAAGGSQVEGLYQRIRDRNEEIRRVREQIATTDIGSYRFVARVFEAGADDVVKWLILVLVLVFDPLAVMLTVGFNVALMRERKPKPVQSVVGEAMDLEPAVARILPFRFPKWATAAIGLAVVVLVGLGAYVGVSFVRAHPRTSHSSIVPGDSFMVLTVRPAELRKTSSGKLEEVLSAATGLNAKLTSQFMEGFDLDADVYAFAKYPAARGSETADRPVMVFGLVAQIKEPAAAEGSLSKLADLVNEGLRSSSATSPALSYSRAMVRYGRGRYLDPRGGFFTFGLTDREAIVLLEIEGDPGKSTIENEIRVCLATPEEARKSLSRTAPKLPKRALGGDGVASVWFDAKRCFADMPKNPAAQSRYQQLEHHLGFDVLLSAKPVQAGQIDFSAEFAYGADRFRSEVQPTAIEVLAKLGSGENAGIPGRLMDRCALAVDYDGLIEHLRDVLGNGREGAAAQVLVEKVIASPRDGRFTLTARYDPKAGAPLVAALRSLMR